jgi:hypothetical protein
VICFLWGEAVPGEHIHQRMYVQYVDNAACHSVVYEWIEMFKNGHTSMTNQSLLVIQPQPQPHRMKKELGN